MKISELSKVIGVPVTSIRDWEKYLELDVPRDDNGHRFYPPEWVEYFKQVKVLHGQGKGYDEIKELLTPPTTPNPDQDMAKQLLELQEKTASLKLNLTQLSTEQTELKTEVTKTQGDLNLNSTEVKALQEDVKLLQEDSGFVKDKVESLQQSTQVLNDGFVTLRKQQAETQQNFVDLREIVNALQGNDHLIEDLKNQLAHVEQQQKQNSNELVGLREDFVTLRKVYEDQNKVLVGLREDIKSLKEQPKPGNDFWKIVITVIILMVVMGAGLASYINSQLEGLKSSPGLHLQR